MFSVLKIESAILSVLIIKPAYLSALIIVDVVFLCIICALINLSSLILLFYSSLLGIIDVSQANISFNELCV